jgi:NAD dependent epimerase/dehydratase family enzyme
LGEKQIEKESVLNADYIVHLAGENIAGKRWSQQRKEAITSREQSAQLMGCQNKVKTRSFISASGVGIYGAVSGRHLHRGKACK